jgi:hypothetical protein
MDIDMVVFQVSFPHLEFENWEICQIFFQNAAKPVNIIAEDSEEDDQVLFIVELFILLNSF